MISRDLPYVDTRHPFCLWNLMKLGMIAFINILKNEILYVISLLLFFTILVIKGRFLFCII